ncbi:MAG: ribonuclease J [bacterium]|nr:ribonuclease J [bacterium]
MNEYKLRFVPLGGVVGVTKNMYLYELYTDEKLSDILILDCGMGFPDANELGVDLIIPDITYLEDKVDKIRGIAITHGHEDHIGALPYLYKKLGSPPVYASKLTRTFIQNKFKELGSPIDIRDVKFRTWEKLGAFEVRFIHMTHSIPDATHVLVKSPVGTMYHGPDFKFDLSPPFGESPDFYEITKAGEEGILCLLSDALGSEREGLTLSESIVGQTLEDEMRSTKGAFFMTTFSSNISRIKQCVDAAIKFNRKVVFMGRSMKQNTEAAQALGYLSIPKILIGNEQEIRKTPPNKLCIIVAGSQGQYDSAMSKIGRKMNKFVQVQKGDKVVFSSDPIPGNEDEVYGVIEELSLQGANVIYPAITDQLHASGHGNQEDLKFLARFTHPRFFIPIGGTVRHQQQYQRLMNGLGYQDSQVYMLREGDTVWFTKTTATRGETIETRSIYVDAYGVGDIGNSVLRDRKTLANDGMVICVLVIDQHGTLSTKPKFFSRGFVFEEKETDMFEKATQVVEKSLNAIRGTLLDTVGYKRSIGKELETFFYKERGRRPIMLVEIIQA